MHLNVYLECDMGYYLSNKDELYELLGWKLPDNFDFQNDKKLKRLEQELFYNSMCRIYGYPLDENEDIVELDDEDKVVYL